MSGYCIDCGNTLCICKLINSNVSAEEHYKTYEELYFESLKVIGMAKKENKKLREELSIAIKYLREAKNKFAPETTNSFVDSFLKKHEQKHNTTNNKG